MGDPKRDNNRRVRVDSRADKAEGGTWVVDTLFHQGAALVASTDSSLYSSCVSVVRIDACRRLPVLFMIALKRDASCSSALGTS